VPKSPAWVIGVLGFLAFVGYIALILATQREARKTAPDALPA
jgi:hypothetical protein